MNEPPFIFRLSALPVKGGMALDHVILSKGLDERTKGEGSGAAAFPRAALGCTEAVWRRVSFLLGILRSLPFAT